MHPTSLAGAQRCCVLFVSKALTWTQAFHLAMHIPARNAGDHMHTYRPFGTQPDDPIMMSEMLHGSVIHLRVASR